MPAPNASPVVQSFNIHIVNSDFSVSDEIHAPSFEAARHQAILSALQIGTDELCRGISFFGAEVRVEEDGELRERFVVSMGQSPLNSGKSPN